MSASMSATKTLPHDPEQMNEQRADWAGTAVDVFQTITGTEDENKVADFLCNLRHWCDRNDVDFERELARGWEMYEVETRREH